MSISFDGPILMFTALVGLYSPVASLSSYFPIVSLFGPRDRRRLALGLFGSVIAFAMVALWVGEPVLTLLGLTTDALTVTGGVALAYVGIPLMRGVEEPPPAPPRAGLGAGGGDEARITPGSVLAMPVTFPLTAGGTTFAIMVSFRAQARTLVDVAALSVAAILYAAVTALTIYASGHVERRVSPKTRALLERLAGILLTAIAISLVLKGAPRMVVNALEHLGEP